MTSFLRWWILSCVTILAVIVRPEARSQEYWLPMEKVTSEDLTKLFFLDSLRGWVVGNKGTILKTTDGGENWVDQESGTTLDLLDIFMLDDQRGWALGIFLPTDTLFDFGTIILSTTDGGTSWQDRIYDSELFYSIVFLDSLRGWMGGEFGTLVGTTNGGQDWTRANVDTAMYSGFSIRKVRFYTPTYGYAVGGRMDIVSMIWRTTNAGEFWTVSSVGTEPLIDLHYWDSLNVFAIGGDLDFGAGANRTTDGGEFWEYIYPAIFGEARAAAFRTDAEVWSPLGFTGTIMVSRDSGRSWDDMYTEDTTAMYDAVFTDSLHGYMVGSRGTMLKFNSSFVGVREQPAMPASYPLQDVRNHPNPFNPSTTISYYLTVKSHVTLAVFDIAGREIRALPGGVQEAGRYEITLHGEGLASGIYFCRVTARQSSGGDSYSLTRKMVLVR